MAFEPARPEAKALVERSEYHTVSEGYGTAPFRNIEVKTGTPIVIDYKVWPLSTFKVLTVVTGSILGETVLWVEQGLIAMVFFIAAMPTYFMFNWKLAVDHRGEEISIRRWLASQEPNMRSFAAIMSALCVFLLSFYTSLMVARWWNIRTAGVGGIKAAATELEMLVYQLVTKEPHVLDGLRRYTLASLLLCFLWRGKQLNQIEDVLVTRKILTPDEIGLLQTWNHNLHETIWAWHTGIVALLYKQGKIHSDQLLQVLLDRCREGRSCMQLIHTHLAVKVPMQYVHMLGFLVKFHNAILAVIMGFLFGAAVNAKQYIICVQLFGRTLLLPFLFNALLCINAELSDPFSGGVASFPRDTYVNALDKDIQAFIMASRNSPKWVLGEEEEEEAKKRHTGQALKRMHSHFMSEVDEEGESVAPAPIAVNLV